MSLFEEAKTIDEANGSWLIVSRIVVVFFDGE